MADDREVMDVRQASQYLGVSRETLYKYLTHESIPAFKLGNRWKFKKTVLDRWMEMESSQHQDERPRRKRSLAGA
jgi:excisionase family DNA binding protein